jgi:hypothetical protein
MERAGDVSTHAFLPEVDRRSVTLPKSSLKPEFLAVGQGASALEVVVVISPEPPASTAIRSAWQARNKGRAAPLLLVVLHDSRASICGPAGDEPPVYEADRGQAERLCREALDQPDRHAALRCLRDALPSIETRLPGIRNEGFLATHELEVGARELDVWQTAGESASRVIGQRGETLLAGLGYRVERCDQVTSILRTTNDGKKMAVAVLLQQNESPELQAERFSKMSPVSYALAVADRENLPYVIVQLGGKLRIYPVRVGVGVGRRGRTETFVQVDTGILRDSDAAYLWLLFSADALRDGGTLERLLNESKRFAGTLAENLRERIYESVVPKLAEGLAHARGLRRPTPSDLADTYEMAMTVLFRLLFIAYGEDKDLLPYRWNAQYQIRSLKHKARELSDQLNAGTPFDDSESLWDECRLLFHAVDEGESAWGVPPYNGGLFSRDPNESPVGASLDEVRLPNTIMGPVLSGLLVTGTPEGLGPVDFRSLGVREFGTIYEGLLESELAVAEADLSLDADGFYRPVHDEEEPVVRRSHIYLHNRSGARKASGTYFTKPFAVEHLLEHAIEPALADHLARLNGLDTDDAGERLFDFRVADIAMGSGHFLVAAVDHIERAFSRYLAERPLAGVRADLAKLHQAAHEALGPLAEQVEIEDTQLLRRLIARRCIYGVDLNPVAVQLARVSIWIHTFVPGLPLSLLDHNLVQGNSLVGIGTVSEIIDFMRQQSGEVVRRKERQRSLLEFTADTLVGNARGPLERLGRIADATLSDVASAKLAYQKAREATRPAEALCDIVTDCRITGEPLPVDLERWEQAKDRLVGSKRHKTARKALDGLQPFHFPIAFPEVFLRARSGFDVLLGNPPWDKLRFESQQYWVTRCPGLNAIPANAREAAIETLRTDRPHDAQLERKEMELRERLQTTVDCGFDMQGRGHHGHHDLAKLFSERAIKLLAPNGCIGIVLPRTALVLGGWTNIREALVTDSTLTTLQARNKSGWLFEDIDYRIMVALLTFQKHQRGIEGSGVAIWPSVTSQQQLRAAHVDNAMKLSESEITTLTDRWVIPWFASSDDRPLFDCLRAFPRLGGGAAWIRGTADSSRWDFSGSGPHRKFVRATNPGKGWRVLMTRHIEAYRIADDVDFQKFIPDPGLLAPLALGVALKNRRALITSDHPIIVFRYPTMNDNTRTMIATALPEVGFLYSKGYAHGIRTEHKSIEDVLALLGYLNSFVCDWWVRRFTDRHMTLPVVTNIPLPQWSIGTRNEVAKLVSAMLIHGGTSVLPGGVQLNTASEVERVDNLSLLIEIEKLVLHGFDLKHPHLITALEDFSENACSDDVRARFLKAIAHVA